MLVATPFDDEAAADVRLKEALGLLYAIHGRNIAYDRLYEAVLNLKEDKLMLRGDTIENPLQLPVPSLAENEKLGPADVMTALLRLPAATQARIKLSLWWIESAIRESGPDAFIRYWTAIEAIAMPNTSNVKAANQRLSRGYDVSVSQAAKEFGLGQIQGLRSDLVHGTRITAIRGELLSYLSALHCDLLWTEVGLKCPGRARNYLASHSQIVWAAVKGA